MRSMKIIAVQTIPDVLRGIRGEDLVFRRPLNFYCFSNLDGFSILSSQSKLYSPDDF